MTNQVLCITKQFSYKSFYLPICLNFQTKLKTIGMNALYKYLVKYADDIHALYKFFIYDTVSGLQFTAHILSESLSSFKFTSISLPDKLMPVLQWCTWMIQQNAQTTLQQKLQVRAQLPPSTFFHFRMYASTHTQAFITIDLKMCLCYIEAVWWYIISVKTRN